MEKFITGTGQTLSVHSVEDCVGLKNGEGCPIHCPSDHHMKNYPLHWRDDLGIFERICKCGIGHPDIDSLNYIKNIDPKKAEILNIHGCCGHCIPPKILSYQELIEVLDYNKETGFFYWKKRIGKRIQIGSKAGGIDKKTGYIRIKINKKRYLAHRLAWFYIHGYLPENDIDHKDQIRHHNWIDNLREVSKICNARNKKNSSVNISGVKGVSWNKKHKKWYANITINYKFKYIGIFDDFDEAVCHRLAVEQCVGWKGCDSNSSAYKYVKENIHGMFQFSL